MRGGASKDTGDRMIVGVSRQLILTESLFYMEVELCKLQALL